MNFLTELLAKLISKLVGPEHAPALSRAIADAGLKLLTLEMSEAETSKACACGGRCDDRRDDRPGGIAA